MGSLSEFNLTKNKFSEYLWHFSHENNASLFLGNDIIQLTKIKSGYRSWCWIGYEFPNIGSYNVTFDINPNKNISHFDFIKIDKPSLYYKTNNIVPNKWTPINVIIDIKEPNTMLYFTFDLYPMDIVIQFKNIKFLPVKIEIKNVPEIINQPVKIEIKNVPEIINQPVKIEKKEENGFIINQLCPIIGDEYYSNECMLKKIDQDTYEILKPEIKKRGSFLWVGYRVNDVAWMKFDICFLSKVPMKNDNFYVKTENPDRYHYDWLDQCVKDQYVSIYIPLNRDKKESLFIFMMDECLVPIHFRIKNVEWMSELKIKDKKRMAVLLCGEMNNHELLREMNKKYLFDCYNCDLFLSTWSGIEFPNDIYQNIRDIHIENKNDWNDESLAQLYKMNDCYEMMERYEKSNQIQYEQVIYFRSDLCLVDYFFHIDSNLLEKTIYTFHSRNFFHLEHIYDIFFYGDRESMRKLCKSAWLNRNEYIDHMGRILYISCLRNELSIHNIQYCIGDIYRNEPMKEYIDKILYVFNEKNISF